MHLTLIPLLRSILRHYPFYTPRASILKLLPDIPVGQGTFEVKNELTIAGYFSDGDIVSKSTFWLGDFDPWILSLLGLFARPGDTVLDIGANIGITTLWLSKRVGPGGRVISVEPVRSNVEKLLANIAVNGAHNVTVCRQGLSSCSGYRRIGVPHRQQGMARIVASPQPGMTCERIMVTTADALLTSMGIDKVAVCKIDVEGHEIEVLNGMEESLARRRIGCFIFERHIDRETSHDPVLRTFERHGYRILRVYKGLLRLHLAPRGEGPRGRITNDFVGLSNAPEWSDRPWVHAARLLS